MKTAGLFFIIDDSITNSVFQGQVLAPLITHKQQNPSQAISIISFEKKEISYNLQQALVPAQHGIRLYIQKRTPYIGLLSLWYAKRQLKKIIAQAESYEIIARGAHAGLMAHRAMKKGTPLTIQARGLMAEEYGYTHRATKNPFVKIMRWFRKRQYFNLERKAYQLPIAHTNITIQAVSRALKTYLHATFGTPFACISIALHDKPPKIPLAEKSYWRATIRTQLDISDDTHVFCYAGSAASWQCPQEIVAYFKERYLINKTYHLLLISPDKETFISFCAQYELPAQSYTIIAVPHQEVSRYLCAADTGILFREKHIMNWVSRPTKLLEYEAAHLAIKHNGTVCYANHLTVPSPFAVCSLLRPHAHPPADYTHAQNHKKVDWDCQSGL